MHTGTHSDSRTISRAYKSYAAETSTAFLLNAGAGSLTSQDGNLTTTNKVFT